MTKYYPDGDLQLQLDRLLNEGLEFQDNFRCACLDFITIPEANTPFRIEHSLGYRPIGYLVAYKELEGVIYGIDIDSWTTEYLFLASSVPNQRVRLIVI